MAHRSRLRLVLGALGVVAIAMIAWVILHKKAVKPSKAQAVAVTEAKVTMQDFPVAITALGAAQAWKSDTILPQVTGTLLSVAFTEGTKVKEGQLLAQIDPALYQAALDQAAGTLKRDQAALDEARIDLVRYQTLSAQNSIAKQQVDTQAALVKQDEGTVLLDQGAVETAKVNLARCRIISPISGLTGVRLIDPGNLVSGGASSIGATTTSTVTGSTVSGVTGIVIVNQIEPIAVTFSVPQGDYRRLAQLSDNFRKPLATEAVSQDTGASLGTGELSIADNRVDPATGTVQMKARFPNAGDQLLPGQYVNVRLTLQTLSHATTVPAAAVNEGPDGAYAYVVGPDQKVAMRPIKVGLSQGATAVIASGLQPGETVVTDGQMALATGSLVRTAPPASPAPAAPAPARQPAR
jgi:multidrug efflux system membrane fusion protein